MLAYRSITTAVLRVLSSRALRVGFVVVAAALGVVAIAREWDGINQAMVQLHPPVLGAALLVVLASLFTSMVLWRLLLAGLGSPLPYRVAARVLYVGQLGKYIPGTVWPMVAQMELGRDHGVPRRRSVTVFVLLMLYTFASGLVVATGTLPLAGGTAPPAFRWAFALTPLVVVLLYPKVLNPLLDRLLRLVKRPPLETPLTLAVSARAAAAGVTQWLIYGLHVWILGVALGADPAALAPLAIGGFALAWCIGYLGVITPAGLGVREVALVAILLPVLDRADAIVVALASRVLITVADLLLAGAGTLSMRTIRPPVDEAPVR
ncbi:lysylphosphatidylglycerol synthase domain-containing protein [Actinopolymorpha sp. B11F2]|uniref:lysylphosphatidylglycerol synthase domain-containing protein n=1 Tax=Actinopolymorpha sp. B11F2 TaxID=3160862 RepID=UPI0032E4C2EA